LRYAAKKWAYNRLMNRPIEFAEFETGLGNEYDIYLLIGPIVNGEPLVNAKQVSSETHEM
jgi:hypothetical protein